MNTIITNKLAKEIASALPKEDLLKYCCVAFVAPFVYAFGNDVMDKGYNLHFKCNLFSCELKK